MSPERPERYFLQNHGGVYRSDDDTATWTSIADGLPGDFGFAMLAHPHRPDVIYNFPLVADVLVPAGRPVPRTAAGRVRDVDGLEQGPAGGRVLLGGDARRDVRG